MVQIYNVIASELLGEDRISFMQQDSIPSGVTEYAYCFEMER